ncbi:MAG: hypothetical protein ACI36W_07310 [Coriobacteriales bacterium]
MDPVLAEIYSTILPSAPYVIAAYAVLLAVLFVFAFAVMRGVRRAEAQMQLVEEELQERSERASE